MLLGGRSESQTLPPECPPENSLPVRAPATPLMGLFKEGKAPIREAIASLAQNLPTLVQQRWTPPKPEAPKREEEETGA